MIRKILPLIIIFGCTSIAWCILGTATVVRSDSTDAQLKREVGKLWGEVHRQRAPILYLPSKETDKETGQEIKRVTKVELASSDIVVDIDLEHRKKGLLWYSTYRVRFDGDYVITNPTDSTQEVVIAYQFPVSQGIYDDFRFAIDGDSVTQFSVSNSRLDWKVELAPGESKLVEIAYGSQGLDEWWYLFGAGVSQLNEFRLVMNTNFDQINFPEKSISPVTRTKTKNGWQLTWKYESLISGVQIGMQLPAKLNPGPFVYRLSYFAPVSLFFFFFLIFLITTLRKIDLHPVNYFFLATGFFSFHLLLAYLVDHINIHLAMAICSIVSVGLVLSYMRLVAGWKFALLATGLSQMVYLVLFSYAFFLEGYTGLAITICSILTLFVVMQVTGRLDWNELFAQTRPIASPEAPPTIR